MKIAEIQAGFDYEQLAPLPPYGELGLFRIVVKLNGREVKRTHVIGPYNKKLLAGDLKDIDSFWGA